MMFSSDAPQGRQAGLEDYLRAIKSHYLMIIIVAAIGVLAALWYSNIRTPLYTAESKVLLGPSPIGAVNQTALRAPVLEREREVIVSDALIGPVAESVGESTEELLERVRVSFIPASEVLTVSFTDPSAETAAAVANGLSQAYVTQREGQAEQLLTDRVNVHTQELEALRSEADAVNLSIDGLTAERLALVATPVSPDRDLQIQAIDIALTDLRNDLSLLRNSIRTAQQNLQSAQSALRAREPAASMLLEAPVPTTATGISDPLLITLGLVAGLTLGLIAALIADRLDKTAKDETSISLALGASALGSIPVLPWGNRSGGASLVMLSKGSKRQLQRARESYRRLRSSVRFATGMNEGSTRSAGAVIMVTSAFPGEGKSLTAANLSLALAQSGLRVALVNADMRRPSLEKLLGLESSEGLSSYLGGLHELHTEVVPSIENFALVPAGPAPANSTELLGSSRMGELVAFLRTEAQFVVIDCPPIMSAADPLVVAQWTDGVIVVVDSQTTDTPDLLRVRAELEKNGATILGAVLNRDRRQARGRLRFRARYADYAA